ncbi:aminotransferase class V-fold PLP-dependent enzyme [Roseomonas sp. PWR1]|uniref:Aminotransferase class V-fold PLP-dependent enzyme n=1 Tax=Roseomonas nitratireducens TaxID=2820810 RepID=A0ABS4AWA3_9PROT|nr:aminotransferase class I/II-fold pyridoxal phosphate-dependent enzyme [Neoroseomonas nitratireducens]MBP0465638.1 aminotransferase class V-fold PLP-dependent enzyme [Neoroseomonas nitratireducens]
MSIETPPARRWAPDTLAAQALGHIDEATRAIVPPIHLATTYIRDPDNQYRSGFVYGRPDNATVREAEAIVAALEGAAAAIVLGSGMSAATAVFLALSPGDHVVAPRVMYWSLRNWLMTEATRWGLRVELVDTTDLDALRAAMRPGETKLVWVETPANPLWSITDLAGAAGIAHAAGAALAVDSTCASPMLTRPIEHGADIVMHAATKYLNGHSDVVAGALATAREDALWERIRRNRATLGQVLGPLEAFLLIRGMRTLGLRVRAASASALALAERFAAHPAVEEVLYPGLPGSPGHAVAARQMKGGFGGMLSLRVKGGEGAAIAAAARVELWKRATSLGGVESLIEHRASIEGAGSPCPPDLLRLSTGIEATEDLFADLDRALRGANA